MVHFLRSESTVLIVETGGDSLTRIGYRFSILENYLFLEVTGGLAASALTPFSPALGSEVLLSYNPFGTKSGRIRPEIYVGARANLGFQSGVGLGYAFEIGTGTDLVGKYFDLFSRGGVDYLPVSGNFEQFFEVGARVFQTFGTGIRSAECRPLRLLV
ncbi:MAG TPA: hypothetical protein VMW69_00965 [Spirochaetia bacterium]|nr:hypothetical protein [Spirochaetia bacterium]